VVVGKEKSRRFQCERLITLCSHIQFSLTHMHCLPRSGRTGTACASSRPRTESISRARSETQRAPTSRTRACASTKIVHMFLFVMYNLCSFLLSNYLLPHSYDPRKFIREAEVSMTARVSEAFARLGTVGRCGEGYSESSTAAAAAGTKAWTFFSAASGTVCGWERKGKEGAFVWWNFVGCPCFCCVCVCLHYFIFMICHFIGNLTLYLHPLCVRQLHHHSTPGLWPQPCRTLSARSSASCSQRSFN
jgi:hypothetical protein